MRRKPKHKMMTIDVKEKEDDFKIWIEKVEAILNAIETTDTTTEEKEDEVK